MSRRSKPTEAAIPATAPTAVHRTPSEASNRVTSPGVAPRAIRTPIRECVLLRLLEQDRVTDLLFDAAAKQDREEFHRLWEQHVVPLARQKEAEARESKPSGKR